MYLPNPHGFSTLLPGKRVTMTEQAILKYSVSDIGSMQTSKTSLLDTRLTTLDQYFDQSILENLARRFMQRRFDNWYIANFDDGAGVEAYLGAYEMGEWQPV